MGGEGGNPTETGTGQYLWDKGSILYLLVVTQLYTCVKIIKLKEFCFVLFSLGNVVETKMPKVKSLFHRMTKIHFFSQHCLDGFGHPQLTHDE